MTDFSELPPHLIFGKILFPCPTKVAVELSFILSKNYWDQDVVSYLVPVPVLDFDEDDDFRGHKLEVWDFDQQDATILCQWLELAFERGVKELEISRSTHPQPIKIVDHPLSWIATFANAKSLTSLKLAGVSLTAFENTWRNIGTDDFLPSLKTLSLKRPRFVENDDSLCKLLYTCKYIEYLSLIDIQFESFEFRLPTCSLKSLEFEDCNLPRKIEIYKAQVDSLESFTWVGGCTIETFRWDTVLWMAGKSLTYLRLGCVKIGDFPTNNEDNVHSFPSLKTISFTKVRKLDLLPLLPECPSLQNMSLVGCRFKKSTCRVRSSTLKSLEVKHCRRLELLQVHEAKNLEYFTFLSQPLRKKFETVWRSDLYSDPESDSDLDVKCAEVILDKSFNLKNNNICVTDLVKFSVNGSRYESGGNLNLKDFFHEVAPYARNNIKISNEAFFD